MEYLHATITLVFWNEIKSVKKNEIGEEMIKYHDKRFLKTSMKPRITFTYSLSLKIL